MPSAGPVEILSAISTNSAASAQKRLTLRRVHLPTTLNLRFTSAPITVWDALQYARDVVTAAGPRKAVCNEVSVDAIC